MAGFFEFDPLHAFFPDFLEQGAGDAHQDRGTGGDVLFFFYPVDKIDEVFGTEKNCLVVFSVSNEKDLRKGIQYRGYISLAASQVCWFMTSVYPM